MVVKSQVKCRFVGEVFRFCLRKWGSCGNFKILVFMKKQPPEIRILTDDVANRIAAGEVVERPSAVAKELLENSVDAGATRVEVEFKHGGKSFIKVSDDGCGMTRQQALTSLEPHATSKIRAPEDLFSISSYGFRGEAVPSIASVSKFKIRTRPETQVFGTEIDVYAGTVNSVRDCGMAAGTEIVVENLFCSVPARRKFLKSDNIEASHIIRLCRLYALALPNVAFTLIENSRVVFRSERGINTIDAIGRIFGSDISEKLFELPETSVNGVSVRGAVLRAGESFPTGRNICAFINGRPVDCKAVYSAVKDAYSQYIPKGRFAAAYLFIDLPPETVDVNVHPAKREVRLKNEFEVRDILFNAISSALQSSENDGSDFSVAKNIPAIAPQIKVDIAAQENLSDKKQNIAFVSPKPLFTPKQTITPRQSEFTKRESTVDKVPLIQLPDDTSRVQKESDKLQIEEEQKEVVEPQFVQSISEKVATLSNNWRYIGCFKKRFVLFETSKGLVMMSISAALKRVRYEEILKSLRGAQAVSQNFLIPVSLKFDRADDEFFLANRPAFEACGFTIEDFGKSFYRILSAPAWLKYADTENFVRDFVEIAREENKKLKRSAMSDENFARALVGRTGAASFTCTEKTALELLARLLSGANHMSSPDGRPTFKEFSEAEIAKIFSL